MKDRFTPTFQEIKSADSILIEQYNKIHIEDDRILGYKDIKNVGKKLKRYIRQYIGIINQKDEKVILIQLIKYSPKKSKQKYFDNWHSEFIVGFGSFYEENSETYLVNIDNKEARIY